MTGAALTRRERLRTAAVAEIKDLARKLLVSGGPQAISLRAIAREMGMTAPAIYRYFPSLDALVLELTENLYEELRAEGEAVGNAVRADDHLVQLADMARAIRRWSVAQPEECALRFGTPLPAAGALQDLCAGPDSAGARFGAPFLAAFAQAWKRAPFSTPPRELIEARLAPHLAPYASHHGTDLPVEVVYAFLSAWTRLYG